MLEPVDYIVDRCGVNVITVPERFRLPREINEEEIPKSVYRILYGKQDRAFGHIAYRPEFADACEENGVKVIFNVRDPRDVVISLYENRHKYDDPNVKGRPLWDFLDYEDNTFVFQKEDVISELIEITAAMWEQWTAWADHSFVYVLKYENLRLRTKEECEKLHDWAGPATAIPDVDTLIKKSHPRPKNPTFRKGMPGEWNLAFKDHHVKLANKLFAETFEKLGYEP